MAAPTGSPLCHTSATSTRFVSWQVVRRAFVAVVVHPTLWLTALRVWARITPRGWWRRAPFLPLPDARYVRYRLDTAYGDAAPDPHDVIAYLRWCRNSEHRE